MTCCWSVSWSPPFRATCSGCSRATCTDGLPPSTDRPGLAFDLSGLVSLRAQSFPLASLTSLFLSHFPLPLSLHCFYADDFTAVVSDHNILAASQRMSDHAADALQWAADHGLQVSVNKSNCTLFTSDTHQSRLDPSVSCNGNTFPLCRSPKLLGVTFDTHFTFSPHIRGVAERARSRLGILQALAGVSWGQSKEVLLLTYQMLIKPILSYAAPVWFPNAPTTAVSSLQSIQNSALRIATAQATWNYCANVGTTSYTWDHVGYLVTNMVPILGRCRETIVVFDTNVPILYQYSGVELLFVYFNQYFKDFPNYLTILW